MGRSQASKDGWTGGDLRGAGESPVYSVCMQGRAQWLHCPPARGQVVPPHGDRQGPSPLLGQALPRFPQDPLLLSRAQAASGVTHPPLRGSPCHPRRHCPPVVEFGGQEKQRPFLHALGGYCPPPAVRSLGGLVLQGTQPRPEPPALRPSPSPGQGVRGGGPSPMCMHLCQEHVWAETQPTRPDGWGCSNVLSHSGIWRSGWAQRRKGLPLAATALPPGLRQALAGLPPLQALVRQPFPLRGARAARGLILLPQHPLLSLIHKCLVQPSKSRPQNGPSRVCGQPPPPQGQRCHTGWMPADTAHQACRKDESCNCCFCSFLSSHSTFSAEALTQRCPGLSQPQAASQGSSSFLSWESTAGMSRKNVPVDMYIPQCCNFVCSNHVNTCMDFIIYILYKSIKAYF